MGASLRDLSALVPLLTLFALSAWAIRGRKATRVFSDRRVWIPLTGLVLFALCASVLPPIVRAAIFMIVLASGLSLVARDRWLQPGLLGLALLSLPLIPNLQFFFGYPLRVLVAECATPLLWVSGFPVHTQGVSLACGGNLVVVDGPCSGIKMMWVCSYLVCGFAAHYDFGWLRSMCAGVLALVVMLLANVLRASALFLNELYLAGFDDRLHDVVGLMVFAVFAVGLIYGLERIAVRPSRRRVFTAALAPSRVTLPLFGVAVALCLAQPLLQPATATVATAPSNLPPLPEEFEGRGLSLNPLLDWEQTVSARFPGRIARFESAGREIIVKQVTRASRKLHPAEVCFKSWGYKIDYGPLFVDREGHTWTQFDAVRGDQRMHVRECVQGPAGQHYTDVSAWYWAALANPSDGPWTAWIVAEPY